MMTAQTTDNVRESFQALAPHGDEMAERFFETLFARQPVLRALLPRDHWQRSRDLMAMLGLVVKNLNRPEAVQHVLMDFGAKAQRIGIMPQQYGLARQALIDAMRQTLGQHWNEDVETDWTEVLNSATSVVLMGAGRSRAKAA